MTVRELKLFSTGFTFDVVVKKPSQCFSYTCNSDNMENAHDFYNRRIYLFDMVNDKLTVYCW